MYYYLFLILLVICSLFSFRASAKVKSTYNAFSDDHTRSRMTGYDTAVRLLRAGNARNVSVGRVKGSLTDHFDPQRNVVNLSETTFGSDSVAAVAVAAHEIGHVMQREEGYTPYRIRTSLVKITNVGTYLALPLVIIGLILDLLIYTPIGFYLAIVGVAFYSLSTVFTLITLPVEYDASKRARELLLQEGILSEDEIYGAKKVLDAAALTYVAALATSLVYFLRFAYWVLLLFGGRRRR